MNGLFDTHCHLVSDSYQDEDINNILEEAKLIGVNLICNVGYDLKTSKLAVDQAFSSPDVFAAVGIHPNDVSNHQEHHLYELEELIKTGSVCAIGEIGLDYYRNQDSSDLQKEWFIKQIKLAKKYQLPILVHIRDAFDDAYEILKQYDVVGIMHCFSANTKTANKFIELGYYISFSGILTFENAKDLQQVAKDLPLNKIVLETDAPYLTPVPYRGTKNYPKNIIFTAKKLASLKKISLNDVIITTTNNAKRILGIK
ncbi:MULTISPECIES: TatD family hydrolase [unclassified Spiroplasma]|uniref:TatD family hydrolase n=1 Tax=unclassified Spiroplasma TaxID=2637901 RepID=UPI00313D0C0D